jgi:hypothetical protein
MTRLLLQPGSASGWETITALSVPRLPFADGGGLSPSRGPGGALERQGHGSAPATMWSTTVLIADGAAARRDTGAAAQDGAGRAPLTSAVHSVRRMTPSRANPADARARECSPRDRPGRAVTTLSYARTEAGQRHLNQRSGRSLRCPSRADQVFILLLMSCSTTKPNDYMKPISAPDPRSDSPASMNSTADTCLDRKPALRLTSRTWPLRVFRWHPRLIQQLRL